MAAFFTELFRIDPAEIESLLDPELERNEEDSLWLRNLGDLELVGLWDVLPNAESDGTLMAEMLAADAALVIGLPENFVTAMSNLADDQVAHVARQWSQMDEMDSWKVSDLEDIIRRIRKLIHDAQANNQIVVQLAEM